MKSFRRRGWARRVRCTALIVCVAAAACSARGAKIAARRPSTVPTASSVPAASSPVVLDPDVAALPAGNGAKIAMVIDDLGFGDAYLGNYLKLPVPLTMAVIPTAPRAAGDDGLVSAAGKQVILHLPLANRPGEHQSGRLTRPGDAAGFVAEAMTRIPHAVGANNHEGPAGSSDTQMMRAVLSALRSKDLFFMDSVTSQRTKGFALQAQFGMPPRINNVFCDHAESDEDTRTSILRLAKIASERGTAIGIGHVHHPYVARVLALLAPQLQAKGYVFAPLSEVTNAPAPGLDDGVVRILPTQAD